MDEIRVLAVNDPAVYAYTEDSIIGITKEWEKHNNCKVFIDILNWENYKETLDNALEDNYGQYDIVMSPTFWLAKLVEDNKIISFDNYIKDEYCIDDIFKSVLDEISYKGKIIAVPSFTDGHILFYRKDKIRLNKIVTFHNLVEALEGYSKEKVLALKASPYEIFLDYLPFFWEEGGNLVKDNKLSIKSQEAINALGKYTFLKKFCPEGVENYGNEQVKDHIQEGDAYIGVSWSGQAASIMNRQNMYRDNIDFATYKYPCNTTWTFVVNHYSKKAETCFNYLSFITNRENDLISGRISGSPVRICSYENKEEIKRNPWYETNYIMLQRAEKIPAVQWWNNVSDKLYSSIYKVFTGQLDIKDGINQCTE